MYSRSAQELSAADLLFLNLVVEASQVKEEERELESSTSLMDQKKVDDGIDVDSSDSGEFYSIQSTPALPRNNTSVESEWRLKFISCIYYLVM